MGRGGRVGARAAAWAIAACLLVACAEDDDAVPLRRERILDHATRVVSARLEDAVARARAAVAGTGAALDAAGDDRARRFEALEGLRRATRVDAILRDGPDGPDAWAGVPVEAPELPDPPPPWHGSFASGDVTYHVGPFLRALLASGPDARGGTARATVVLRGPSSRASPYEASLEERWAAELGVREVRVLAPAALERPPGLGVRRATVPRAGPPALVLEVEAPPDEGIEARIALEGRRSRGWLALAGLAVALGAAVAAVRRWARGPVATGVAIAVGALLLRQALLALDLPARFPEWGRAFRAVDFGVTGFLGWFSNPGAFALSCLAGLAAAHGTARAAAGVEPPDDRARCAGLAIVGSVLAFAATRAWLFLVEAAAVHSQVDFFSPGTLAPSLPRALLLGGLTAATAAGWILARAGLRLVAVGAGPAARLAVPAAAVAAAFVAGLLSAGRLPSWAPVLLPAAAALLGRLGPGDARPSTPSRILLVSILAVALVFPVLWATGATASRAVLRSQVSDLVGAPATVASRVRLLLETLVEDSVLVRAFETASRDGVDPEGLALYAWRRLGFDDGRDGAMVVVYRGQDRRVDRFGLDVPAYNRLPDPRPDPEGDADPITVTTVAATGERVAGTVGRVRVKAPDGKVLGTLAVVLPDPLSVLLHGVSPRMPRPRDAAEGDRRAPAATLTLLREGRVALSTDPSLPRNVPPPLDVRGVSEPTWLRAEDGTSWLVVPAGERGVVLAQPEARTLEDVLFGLARVAVVGVGLGAVLAFAALAIGARRYRPRLQDKILGSYFAVTVLPLVCLGYASWRDALARAEEEFRERQASAALSARSELEGTPGARLDTTDAGLRYYGESRALDLSLYERGDLRSSTQQGLVEAEILPPRLDAAVYRATEIEGRDLTLREEALGGRPVRVAYTPVRDEAGRPVATLAVLLFFDSDRAEQRAAETGSVLLAAYLLTVVLVVVIGIYTARGLASRLGRLAEATKRVASGELGEALPGAGRDEIGSLVDAFNAMTTELRAARERAARAERETAWRGMARQVAHEIKNPLTPMKLMLQQLVATAKADPSFAARTVEPTAKVVLEQIDALSRIASDFSAFARFPPRDLERVDVNEVVRSVVALHAGGAASEATVAADLAEGLPPVRWDRDELQRVFLNLVANAVQAVDERRGRVRVDVRTRSAKVPASGRDGVLVTVEDDGVGIPAEHRARLFEPEFSTKTHGTGLGLALVKRILSDLAGEIRIDSEPGRGTTVSVWLPADDEAAGRDGVAGDGVTPA